VLQHNQGRGIRREVKNIRLNDTAARIESERKHAEAMKAAAKRRKESAETYKRNLG
jgi:hypothetical protein